MTRRCLHLALPLATALATLAMAPATAAEGDISKVNGAIEIAAGTRAGSVETVNGAIRIGADATTGDAETVNGGIRVGDGARVGDLSTVNGGIRTGRNVRIDGDVETVNGEVFVDRGGALDGDVSTVNGAVGLVATEVRGGISMVGGDLTVGVDSRVHGGIRYEKPNASFIRIGRTRPPRVIIGPGAQVDGPLVFEREVELHVHATARTGAITGATATRFDTPTPTLAD